ncbi:MAG: hypothetical protein KKA73_26370 [Chloroflexi bacterium]|nr:hypothetical protein [Chloroflexota bacterium]
MTQFQTLIDEWGIIHSANADLPSDKLKIAFVEALAELEDRECHRTHTFPKTRTHKVTGIKQAIYRSYVDKTSGWRIHFQYNDGTICLSDIIEGSQHDDTVKVIKAKKHRYR